MRCKHCGYDVPDGIEFCTNCGEPMPRLKPEEAKAETANLPQRIILSKKEFTKNYVPHSVRLAIHTGAIISYLYSLLYFVSLIGYILLDKVMTADILFMIVAVILAALTLGFEIKKNPVCAVAVTGIAVLFSLYCLAVFHQLTVIWICAGFLGCYGTFRYHKLWSAYQKTGLLPKKID